MVSDNNAFLIFQTGIDAPVIRTMDRYSFIYHTKSFTHASIAVLLHFVDNRTITLQLPEIKLFIVVIVGKNHPDIDVTFQQVKKNLKKIVVGKPCYGNQYL